MATAVVVPPLGTNVDTVTLVRWYKREGEEVAAGEPLFAVETDKAVLDVEAPASGILHGVLAAEGDEVAALSEIAWLGAEGEASRGAPASRPAESVVDGHSVPQSHQAVSPDSARRFASPWARTLARERELDWTALAGSGPMGAVLARDVEAVRPSRRSPATPLARRMAGATGADIRRMTGTGHMGRITRDDVTAASSGRAIEATASLRAQRSTPDQAVGARITDRDCFATLAMTLPNDQGEPVETFALTGIRGRIAERMYSGAHETAPVTLTTEVDATRFVETRRRLVAEGLRVSYNDLLMLVVSRALREHPRMNVRFENDHAMVCREINIALAVDTDRGLLAPVVRGVETLSLAEIAAATASIIERARNAQITPDELHGSTFTITNLGMFGIDAFTPIINTPECAILGVGRIKPTPWVVGDCIGIRQAMWLSLTFDHRLVDGGPAARFLQTIARAIEAGV